MRKLILTLGIITAFTACGIIRDPYTYWVRETRTEAMHHYKAIEFYDIGDTVRIIPSGSEFVVVERAN